jgi:hypothetical protein
MVVILSHHTIIKLRDKTENWKDLRDELLLEHSTIPQRKLIKQRIYQRKKNIFVYPNATGIKKH